MCFSWHTTAVDADVGVRREGLVRVLEQVVAARGRDRGHRRREVGEPARVQGEPAHHLERAGGVLLLDGDPAVVGGLDDPLAEDVGEVELVGVALRRDGDGSGLTGSYQTRSAGTETISFSG